MPFSMSLAIYHLAGGDVFDFGVLKGLTLTKAEVVGDERINFETKEGFHFVNAHIQDCCEDVTIEDINGDLQKLIGEPLLVAEGLTNVDRPPPPELYHDESYTWTFYKLANHKEAVDIRWFGQSNGYYGEEAHLFCTKTPAMDEPIDMPF